MKQLLVAAAMVLMVALIGAAEAQDNARAGYITNIVARTDGLLIEIDNGIPAACEGTAGNWMIIPNESKTMLALALLNSDNGKLMEFYKIIG